jgi:hypothetical protein
MRPHSSPTKDPVGKGHGKRPRRDKPKARRVWVDPSTRAADGSRYRPVGDELGRAAERASAGNEPHGALEGGGGDIERGTDARRQGGSARREELGATRDPNVN